MCKSFKSAATVAFFILRASFFCPSDAAAQAPAATNPPRRQAYLQFIEARRLKHEAQSTRDNERLLQQAIAAYVETIRLDPAAAEPRVDLGELYFFFQQRRDLAEREAVEAIKLDPACVGAHLLLARLSIAAAKLENNPRSPQLERARRAYEAVAKLDANHAEAWALLAELYRNGIDPARYAQALEHWAGAPVPNDTAFYRWLTNDELTPDRAFAQLSRAYLNQGRRREAADAARRAYEADPDSNDHARNLMSVLRAATDPAEELKIYARLARTADSPALQIGYGAALIRAGRHAEAIERLREYVKLDPANSSVVSLLSAAQRRAGQRQAAVETLKAGLARADETARPALLLELAETYQELGRDTDAVVQYERMLDNLLAQGTPTEERADLFEHVVNELARVCRRSGNQTKLQAVLNRARRHLSEQNPMLDLLNVEGLREEGRFREALDVLRAAARRAPESRTLKLTEALVLSEQRKFAESAELLRSLLKGTGDYAAEDAGVQLILSGVQLQAGLLNEAEAAVRKALELNPDDGDALLQLSSIHEKAGRRTESERLLRELLQRDPDNATALNNLGYFLAERGARLPEALALIEQAVAIKPIQGGFLDSLGWANHKLGRHEQAREQLEKAIFYSRRNATLHDHLGDVLRTLGRLNDARRHWEKALEYALEDGEIARLKEKLKEK